MLSVWLVLAMPAHAQTWIGTTSVWNTGSNWSTGAAPTNTTAGTFGSSSNYNLTFTGAPAALGLTFNTGVSNGYTFTNNGYTLTIYGSGIINNNNLTQSFSAPVATGANQTWNAASGGLTFSAVTLSNTLTLTGSSTISITGTLTNSTGNRTITNNITSPAGATFTNINLSEGNTGRTLTLSGTGITTVSGVIGNGGTGTGALSKTGTGTLVLSGANTYSGTTTLSAGTLVIANNSALGSGTLSLSGGTVQGDGSARTVGNALTLATSSTVAGNSDLTFNGALTNTGNNTLTVSNTGAINFSGINLSSNGTTRTLTFSIGSGAAATVGGVIANGGTAASGNIVKTGAGTLTLSGANTYTGTTTIGTTGGASGGTLMFGASNVLSAGTVTVYAGTLDLNSFSNTIGALTLGGGAAGTAAVVNTETGVLTLGGNVTFTATNNPNGATINGNLALGAANRTFTIGDSTAATADLTVNAVISGADAITKAGAGTLVLSGANTYTGATTISAGVLNIQNNSALGTNAAGASVTSGAALQMQGGITESGEALTLNGTGIATDGALRNISGNNTWTGAITLGAATRINSDADLLTLSNITGTNRALTVGGAGNTAITGAITTGTGTLTKDGAGTLTLTGADTYTGATTVSAGILNIQNATALGTAAGGASVTSGATLQLQSTTGITVGAEALTLNGVGTSNATGALENVSGANTYGGLITLGSASTISSDAGSTLNLTNTGTIAGSGYGLTLAGAGNGTLSSIIGTGAGTLTKTGAGTWTLSGVNTYTGATTISGGVLSISADRNLGAVPGAAIAGSLTLNGGTLQATANMTLSSNRGITLGAGGGTLDVSSSNTLTYGGIIAGAGSLTKADSGTLVLSGANTYTGATNITGGTLTLGVANAISTSSAVAIASGATLNLNTFTEALGPLSGAGTVQLGSGSALVMAGGANQIGNLSVTASSAIDFGTGSSTLNVTSSVSGSGTLTIENWTAGVDYFYSTTMPTDLANIDFVGYSPGATATWDSADGFYVITPVPEPPAYGAVFMLIGLCGIALRRLHGPRRTASDSKS